ncbi:hypothetical protein [Streptomyces sp. NBC_00009]|uniref:hypothetical protein n=1 Tax=Streptomyces sp. NBC_00009 TaxID=2975620 RepID=UPI0032496BBF
MAGATTRRCACHVREVSRFQWGRLADVVGADQPGPVMSMMPIFMIGVVRWSPPG